MKTNTIGWNTGMDFNAGSLPNDPKVLEGIKAQLKGHLVAWDPVAQKEVWRAQFEHPWNGGTLATAGNLVFHGNSRASSWPIAPPMARNSGPPRRRPA